MTGVALLEASKAPPAGRASSPRGSRRKTQTRAGLWFMLKESVNRAAGTSCSFMGTRGRASLLTV